MRFLRGVSFADESFTWRQFDGLDSFVHEAKGAEREFIDADLEILRKDLIAASDARS